MTTEQKELVLNGENLTGIAIVDFDLRRVPFADRPAEAKKLMSAFKAADKHIKRLIADLDDMSWD